MKKDKLLLIDTNVLLALAWPNHPFHLAANRRLDFAGRWATCAITQLRFIRLSSNPAIVSVHVRPVEAQDMLSSMTADPLQIYLEDKTTPLDKLTRDLFGKLQRLKIESDLLPLPAAKPEQPQ